MLAIVQTIFSVSDWKLYLLITKICTVCHLLVPEAHNEGLKRLNLTIPFIVEDMFVGTSNFVSRLILIGWQCAGTSWIRSVI